MPFFGVPIRNGLPIGLGSVAGFGVQQFDPSQLFEGGTVAGAWYDPSDLSTMFTTSAGTTPVAMPGQGAAVPVGAMLDKRALAHSVYFDGTGDYLSTSVNAGNFGSDPFTVEAWVYLTVNNVGSIHAIASNYLNSTTGWALQTSAGKMGFNASGDGSDIIGTTVLSTNTWYHIAVSGAAGSIKLFINGTQEGSTYTGAVNLNGTSLLSVGALIFLSNPFNTTTGYISNVRIVKGTAVYTGNFTPPTAPLSPISGTSLLTCGTTWSGNPAITTVGNTRVDGLNPFTASPVGNHAISFNNTTARPELRARVNLLTYSEEFDNGAWGKTNLNTTGTPPWVNVTASPDGTMTADALIPNTSNGQHYVVQSAIAPASRTLTLSVCAKKNGYDFLGLEIGAVGANRFDLSTPNGTVLGVGWDPGVPIAPATITPLGNGWFRCSITVTTTVAASVYIGVWSTSSSTSNYTGNGTSGIYIWGADLRPANIGANVPAYQRIADANTYDTNGFPLYLRFDGIDDSMYTPANLNLSGTDKVAVFAGVRKFGTTVSVCAELSAASFTNAGSFGFYPENIANSWASGLRGASNTRSVDATTYVSPLTSVVSTKFDIAQSLTLNAIEMRVNGATGTVTPSDPSANLGGGNFGTYPLFIGARNNSSLWFNGHLYSLIIAGSAVSAGNISATEQWVAQRTGIAIP